VWWRKQGGEDRAYVDLRKWGGTAFHALRAPGSRRALTRAQAALAEALAVKLIQERTTQRAAGTTAAALALPEYWPLDAAVREHLRARDEAGNVTAGTRVR